MQRWLRAAGEMERHGSRGVRGANSARITLFVEHRTRISGSLKISKQRRTLVYDE